MIPEFIQRATEKLLNDSAVKNQSNNLVMSVHCTPNKIALLSILFELLSTAVTGSAQDSPPGRVCCVWLVCFSTFYCTVNEGRHVWFTVFVNAFSKLH